MIKATYNFENKLKFYEQIKQIDIAVPLRSRGRKKDEVERYSIVSFLLNILEKNLISFPMKIVHRNKPDFLIETQTCKIGIEVSEVIPEQLARAEAILEKQFPNGMLELEFFRLDAPNRNNSAINEILYKTNKGNENEAKLIGSGLAGHIVEENWVRGIIGSIYSKTKKMNKVGFDKFQNNWLVLYDNQASISLNYAYSGVKLEPYLIEYKKSNSGVKFGNAFILSGNSFFHLDLIHLNFKQTLLI